MAEGGPLGLLVFATIFVLIGVLAFSIRLFSVIKYESIIHEFDPYFNYRVTQYLTKAGIYEFWNWFDDRTWYPLGRVIGGTVYPGLTLTAGTMWWVAQAINIPLSVETVCVFTAPVFSAFASWATFLLTKEVKGTGAGLTAAVLLAMVPSYISRSVAGSYDNEAVAIFALVLTFYLYVKTLNTGSLFYATLNSLAYFYMTCSWGGYTFIINLIPIHVLLCLVTGRYSSRLYIAFAPLVVLGTLLAALVPVVGFNAVMTSEHFAAFLVFVILHVVALERYIRRTLDEATYRMAFTVVVAIGTTGAVVLVGILIALVAASPTKGWSGRSLSLLDPTYASKYIPIIASVSEHQPPTWPSYFMDINILAFLAPAGIIACFRPLTDSSTFIILYMITSVYFSGVMVRLMLVLAPAACIVGGIALSAAFETLTRSIKYAPTAPPALLLPAEKEPDYLRDGQYRIDSQATQTMLNSLMYKLSYYRFAEATMDGKGYDRVRRTEIGKKQFRLTHFEEVFTSHHWMVRIYKLKEQKNKVRGKIKRKSKASKSKASSTTKRSASKGRSQK
uniref:dolichyl-diphosphooligosaccharide--protein glycotransferase n=1 Tax=Physcomitrium patens TaxID=3218 RepID=A0A2K1JPA0_PHYPA|nr:hypothetical protein PHYPA_015752 [Physcomitrium patens]